LHNAAVVQRLRRTLRLLLAVVPQHELLSLDPLLLLLLPPHRVLAPPIVPRLCHKRKLQFSLQVPVVVVPRVRPKLIVQPAAIQSRSGRSRGRCSSAFCCHLKLLVGKALSGRFLTHQ
jgi:hypothetical protein